MYPGKECELKSQPIEKIKEDEIASIIKIIKIDIKLLLEEKATLVEMLREISNSFAWNPTNIPYIIQMWFLVMQITVSDTW